MGETDVDVDGYRVEPLGPATWDLFAALAEKHNGVWGGCWCTWFHRTPELAGVESRELKQTLVAEGRAHAALVVRDGAAIAWAEYGPVEELPNIHHRKQWEAGLVQAPDYRITCLFVDRDHRRRGVAAVAVRGALDLIADAGGGRVESYPHDLAPGAKPSSSFLYNATRTMYERLGFTYERPKGKGNCVMTTVVAPAHAPAP